MFNRASLTLEPSLFFGNYFFFCLWFENDLQHYFAGMTDEAYCSVVVAELKVSFLWEGNDEQMRPGRRPLIRLPDLVADNK